MDKSGVRRPLLVPHGWVPIMLNSRRRRDVEKGYAAFIRCTYLWSDICDGVWAEKGARTDRETFLGTR